MRPSSPRGAYLPECDALPPADLVVQVDWRAEVERLYRDRAAGLIHHFAGVTRDRDDARDLVHEAFSRYAALGFTKRVTVVRPESYLFRICLNLFHDRGRTQVRHRILEQAVQASPVSNNMIAQLESRETLRRLERAMLALKPKTRAIFLARRLDGLPYAEIAQRTGLSVKGVEKQMAKAIATIDRLMERSRS